ncbi:MAG: type II toxin-antitoxin system PemK/MazF family toxin [Gemmatimonadota bacterium]|nr:type II toxin-antitoxin system PemK/MazF family toxin [Gemmatimonadota bacterium]MDE2870963.1 type II toxin-antitoxin system PemK/MazF family toxin [Gemmatimonadota bacterium]
MTFEPFDTVVVPLPFTDRRGGKRRPALLVSSSRFNRTHRQSILAMITSSPTQWPSDVAIRAWRQAGLRVPCKVRFKLFTLDDERIVRRLGALAPGDREAVGDALSRLIATG